jgi:hypothetical protein
MPALAQEVKDTGSPFMPALSELANSRRSSTKEAKTSD